MTNGPSLGITVTQTVREGIRIIMQVGPRCPTCGRGGSTMKLSDVSTLTGVSEATLSRFLNGRGISSDVLDKLYEWVNARLPEYQP